MSPDRSTVRCAGDEAALRAAAFFAVIIGKASSDARRGKLALMGRVYNPKDENWRQVDRRGADGVTSHMLLPVERGGRTRLSLTCVEAGGTFGPHIDDYEHVFCVHHGHGEAMVGKLRRKIEPGDVIVTDVNEPHGLWASPDEELVLVTANIYQE